MTARTRRTQGFTISTNPRLLDLRVVHQFLTRAYWSPGISLPLVRKSIKGSLPFGVYRGQRQVGFARVISDYATYAYIADVFVLEEYRGRGLSKLLMKSIMTHPKLQGLRRWSLVTRDAHRLYAQFGFQALANPERHMEIVRRDIYASNLPTRSRTRSTR